MSRIGEFADALEEAHHDMMLQVIDDLQPHHGATRMDKVCIFCKRIYGAKNGHGKTGQTPGACKPCHTAQHPMEVVR